MKSDLYFLRTSTVLVLFCLLIGAPAAAAQAPLGPGGVQNGRAAASQNASGDEPSPESVASRLGELEQQIKDRRQSLRQAPTDNSARISEELALLEDIHRVLRQQASLLGAPSEPEGSERETRESLVGHSPPFSLVDLDRILDQRDSLRDSLNALRDSLAAATRGVEEARQAVEAIEARRRQARGAATENSDPGLAAVLQQRLRLAQLRSEAAGESLRLRQLQLERVKLDVETVESRFQLVEATERWVRANLAIRPEHLQDRIRELDGEIAAIDRELTRYQIDLERTRSLWSNAEKALDERPNPEPALVETAKAWERALGFAESSVELRRRRQTHLERLKRIWSTRYEHHNAHLEGARREMLVGELEEDIRDLERNLTLKTADLEVLQIEGQELGGRLQVATSPLTKRALEEQNEKLTHFLELQSREVEELSAATVLAERTLSELQGGGESLNLWRRVTRIWDGLLSVWHFELWVVEDDALTVGKLVTALILILLGLSISRYLSRQLGRRLLPQLGLDKGAIAAFQSVIFYFLLVGVFLYALRLVSIPLTLFTFLGGALAIGLGFGSQNIVNNFISGLILMAERPIKVGDIVDVDGIQGNVEHIGARSTRIRTGSNTHVIVPNSAFLEKSVLNWTLSDDEMRTEVDVGVLYGSPTREVERLIRKALDEEEKVLKTPAPEVVFMEFGDNALIFRAFFWIKVLNPLDRMRIQSRVRYTIDGLFREAGITIAFPQRDVHLDSISPLEIRLVEEQQVQESAKAESSE